MSKLDEMIRELCPDGAEYVKLNSVYVIFMMAPTVHQIILSRVLNLLVLKI